MNDDTNDDVSNYVGVSDDVNDYVGTSNDASNDVGDYVGGSNDTNNEWWWCPWQPFSEWKQCQPHISYSILIENASFFVFTIF